MGVMQQKRPAKMRPGAAAPAQGAATTSGAARPATATTPGEARPAPARAVRTVAAASTPPAPRKEQESARKAAPSSPKDGRNQISTVVVPTPKVEVKPESDVPVMGKEVCENLRTKRLSSEGDDLDLRLSNMTLNEDNDLNLQLKNLELKDEQQDSEDSGLLSRGPDRIGTKGSHRNEPYVYEEHFVSRDNNGGARVLYPSILQSYKTGSHSKAIQEGHAASWPYHTKNSENFSHNNDHDVPENNVQETAISDFQNVVGLGSDAALPLLTEKDLKILEDCTIELLCSSENTNQQSLADVHLTRHLGPGEQFSNLLTYNIDEIIESKKYDKEVPQIKQELFKEGTYKQLQPTTPDSAYESDECSIGSPSSTVSTVLRTDSEKAQTVGAPFAKGATQHPTLLRQSGFPAASVSPVIQRMVLVLQQQQPTVMPPPLPTPLPQQQPLAPSSTPPLSSSAPRRILPGVNIPPPCNEPAINRIMSVMEDEAKEKVWPLIFAMPDPEITKEDDDGNRMLYHTLANRSKYKNFLEVLYALIQRMREIIGQNRDLARKLLATPNKHGHSPLDIACRSLQSGPQDALAVRYLADTMVEENLEIGEEIDSNGDTLLHRICAYCGDKAKFIMAELLSMKNKRGESIFDVNRKNNQGQTPLHVAAVRHSDQNSCSVLVQLLIRIGASTSMQEGCSGNTVLHCVAHESCDPDLIVTFLANTCDVTNVVNQTNYNGDTPLHLVAANHAIPMTRQRQAVRHLIEFGAQPRLQNNRGRTPLSFVAADRKQDIKTVLYHR